MVEMSGFWSKAHRLFALHMSAFGPKRTSLVALHMSAFGSKADILKLIFRNAAPIAVALACHLVREGRAAALSSRPGPGRPRPNPVGYDLGRLRDDRRRNGNDVSTAYDNHRCDSCSLCGCVTRCR